MSITPKQQRFIEEYLLNPNATQAALKAGYAKSTAQKKAPMWVGKSRKSCPANMQHVWDAVHDAQKARSERTLIDADYVLRRHAEIDQMDVVDIMNDHGGVKPISEWPQIWRQFVSGVEVSDLFDGVGEERTLMGLLKKIKWPDKLKNLELLGKHVSVQAYKDKLEVEPQLVVHSLDDKTRKSLVKEILAEL